MKPAKSRGSVCVLLLGALLCAPAGRAAAQSPGQSAGQSAGQTGDESAPEQKRWKLKAGLEVKANYRDSQENRFAVPFPFQPSQLPVGQTKGFEATVDPGAHFEVSNVTLYTDAAWGDWFTAHGKFDIIDLYDRNPTSTGETTDIDEAWIRLGAETPPATLAPHSGVYFKLGKFAKFERQNDRHLESYGVVSTAFNRFEETGSELGIDLGRHFYVKARAAIGNPVFLRDPNALAGDNGTPVLMQPNPDPSYKTGIDILYNAHFANFYLDGKLETGAAIGWRLADEEGRNGIDLLVWGNRRKLEDSVGFHGSFYGGDLHLLTGPFNDFPFPIKNDDKRETGGNVWLYRGGLSFFGQYVDQDLAGLPRKGLEGELAWRVDLPLVWAIGDRQLFTFIAPAVRYSRLDNDFQSPAVTPSPSFAWDWVKIDTGIRLGIYRGIDLTAEYADNRFTLKSGAKAGNNEYLTTLRWRI
jgi:hypothetical protein